MINPIAEMKRQPSTQTALNRTQNAKTGEALANAPADSKNAQRAFHAIFPQLARQFQMLADSVARCWRDFPDCFHHKRQTAKECEAMAEAMKLNLFVLRNLKQNRPLNGISADEVKQAMSVNRFLLQQCEQVIAEVKRVEGLAAGKPAEGGQADGV